MKKLTLNIEPLKGFGELEFGITPEDAAEYLGTPDEEETLEDTNGDETDTVLLHFDEHDISLFFEEDEDNKYLVNIETGNENATLFGKAVFKMTEDEIVDLMKQNGYTELDIEDGEDDEFPDDRRVSFDEAMMDFFFMDSKLASVSWGSFFADDDELED
jgi:hypothetical protein